LPDAANSTDADGFSSIKGPDGSVDTELVAGEGRDSSSPAESRNEPIFEFTTAFILAVAGLASAWASFQGGLWDKLESEKYASANAYLTESSQLMIRSGQEQSVTAALFLQWLDAKSDRQEKRASIIENHMPPWFAGEFAAWRAQLPEDLAAIAPNAPLPRFYGPSLEKAVARRTASDTARAEAESAGRSGDTYDIANVVLAMGLFLAGITSVLRSRRGRHVVMGLAAALTMAAVVSMFLAPSLLP
jgi:hypothetical protein